MPSPKLPNSITNEELLKLVQETKGQDDTPDVPEPYDILAFLGHFNITDGKHRVRLSTLYRLYTLWSRDPIKREKFDRELKPYLVCSPIFRNFMVAHVNMDALTVGRKTMEIITRQSKSQVKMKGFRRHFEAYLTHYNLTAGDYWVESFVLYYLYDKWCYKINRKYRLGEKTFFNFCNLYFESKRRTESRMMWFAVSKSILNQINEQQLQQLREGRRFRYVGKGKTKKRKSKKQTEIPGSKTSV